MKIVVLQGRQRINVNGQSMNYAQYVWNLHNPDNLIRKGDNCVIHHKDENPLNDVIENLQKMTRADHMRLHSIGNEFAIGMKHSNATKMRMSLDKRGEKNPMFGKHLTPEHKSKMSLALKGKCKGKIVSEETRRKLRLARRVYYMDLRFAMII
jgi:hypothetical protein